MTQHSHGLPTSPVRTIRQWPFKVLPTTVAPYFESNCAAVPCPATSEGTDVPSGCRCKLGRLGASGTSWETGAGSNLVPSQALE